MPPVALSHPETSDSPAPDCGVRNGEQAVGDKQASPVGAGLLVHIAMRRARFVARFIYWSFRHGSTANAGWVCNYEGLYW